MSKGPGSVQRAIIQVFAEHPGACLTVRQLAEHAFPHIRLEQKHLDATARAVNGLVPQLGLVKRRTSLGFGKFGWCNTYMRQEALERLKASQTI